MIMSGGTLPTTGIGAATVGVAGTYLTLPLPVWLAIVGATLTVLGVALVRTRFRRGRSVGAR
jgi:membrane protein implicated in regulation of membrane protease activity